MAEVRTRKHYGSTDNVKDIQVLPLFPRFRKKGGLIMYNIGLIVPMPFRNTCHYTYIIYLGIKINSPNPTRPRETTVAETVALMAGCVFVWQRKTAIFILDLKNDF